MMNNDEQPTQTTSPLFTVPLMCVGQLNRQRDFPSSNQYLIYKKGKKENHLKYKTAIIFITFFSLRCLETIVRVINERC